MQMHHEHVLGWPRNGLVSGVHWGLGWALGRVGLPAGAEIVSGCLAREGQGTLEMDGRAYGVYIKHTAYASGRIQMVKMTESDPSRL